MLTLLLDRSVWIDRIEFNIFGIQSDEFDAEHIGRLGYSRSWLSWFINHNWMILIVDGVATVISLVLQQRLKKRPHMPRRTASVVSTMSMSSMSSVSSSDLRSQCSHGRCSTGSIAKFPHHPPLSRSSSMVMEAFISEASIKPFITLDTSVEIDYSTSSFIIAIQYNSFFFFFF